MIGNASEVEKYLSLLSQEKRDKKWKLSEYKPKRSNAQNSYYWELCTAIADSLRVSKNRTHNTMLRRYGQLEMLCGELFRIPIPNTEEAEIQALEAETFHIKPTSHVKQGNDGKMYRTYILIRGSSTYDTREMSILLDGAIEEAKACGIETMTPHEIERLKALDKKKVEV